MALHDQGESAVVPFDDDDINWGPGQTSPASRAAPIGAATHLEGSVSALDAIPTALGDTHVATPHREGDQLPRDPVAAHGNPSALQSPAVQDSSGIGGGGAGALEGAHEVEQAEDVDRIERDTDGPGETVVGGGGSAAGYVEGPGEEEDEGDDEEEDDDDEDEDDEEDEGEQEAAGGEDTDAAGETDEADESDEANGADRADEGHNAPARRGKRPACSSIDAVDAPAPSQPNVATVMASHTRGKGLLCDLRKKLKKDDPAPPLPREPAPLSPYRPDGPVLLDHKWMNVRTPSLKSIAQNVPYTGDLDSPRLPQEHPSASQTAADVEDLLALFSENLFERDITSPSHVAQARFAATGGEGLSENDENPWGVAAVAFPGP